MFSLCEGTSEPQHSWRGEVDEDFGRPGGPRAWARGLGTVAQCALRKRQSLCVIAPIRIRLSN